MTARHELHPVRLAFAVLAECLKYAARQGLTDGRRRKQQLGDAIAERDTLHERIAALHERIEAARALHTVYPDGEWFCIAGDCECHDTGEPHKGPVCAHCSFQGLVDDPEHPSIFRWPCETVRALDGEKVGHG